MRWLIALSTVARELPGATFDASLSVLSMYSFARLRDANLRGV